MPNPSLDTSRIFQHLDDSLVQLRQHQSETLQVHAQYLSHQMEYAKLFCNLAQQQGTLYADFAQGSSNREIQPTQLTVLEGLERNLTHFHEHQTQTLELHGRSLDHQTDYARNLFHLAEYQYRALLSDGSVHTQAVPFQEALPAAPPLTSAAPPLVSPPLAQPTAVKTVESVTFPTESSRNGHNSAQQPSVPSQNVAVTPVAPQRETPAVEFKPLQPAASASSAVAVDLAELETVLLAIVSEKTGYPSEMLELEMDMEADLGIDSIKRVEILGALQERFPSPVQPNLEDLAELRTLAQIAAYMAELSTGRSQPEGTPIRPEAPDREDSEPTLAKSSNGNGLYQSSENGSNGNGLYQGNDNGSNGNGNGNGLHHARTATAPKESRNGSHRETATAIAPHPDEPLTAASPLPELDLDHPLSLQLPTSPGTVADIDVEILGEINFCAVF